MMYVLHQGSKTFTVELENGFISQPVIDVEYASVPFFPTDPLDALESGEFATDVGVLLGSRT